jgi:hypothetical protein
MHPKEVELCEITYLWYELDVDLVEIQSRLDLKFVFLTLVKLGSEEDELFELHDLVP